MRINHGFVTILRRVPMLAALTCGVLVGQSHADVEVIAIDFGQGAGDNCDESPLYTGSFDGATDFVPMTISNCGIVESPQIDLGNGATFGFTNVTGWNNTDGAGPDDVRALTGDHFFSNWQGSGPVSFSLDGMDPGAIVVLQFADRKGGERALVTFEGVTTMVDGVQGDDGVFTTVGVVTGSS